MVVNGNKKAKLTLELDMRLIDLLCTDSADGVFETVSDAAEHLLWNGLLLEELLDSYESVRKAYDEYNDNEIIE